MVCPSSTIFTAPPRPETDDDARISRRPSGMSTAEAWIAGSKALLVTRQGQSRASEHARTVRVLADAAARWVIATGPASVGQVSVGAG